MLPSVSQNLLLILFFWVLFNYGPVVPVLLVVIAALVEGLGIRATGRVFGLDPNTGQSWLVAAAEQLSAFATHFLVDLEPQQVQLDEVFASLAHLQEIDSELVEFNRGSSWLWTAMDPVTKLLLVVVVGERSLVVAQAVVHQVKQRLVGRRVLKRVQAPLGLEQQASLFLVYCNFCLSHASLRLPLAEPQPTRGNGSFKKWQMRTPAMASGLTDPIWSLREVLLYRVPPWPQAVVKV